MPAVIYYYRIIRLLFLFLIFLRKLRARNSYYKSTPLTVFISYISYLILYFVLKFQPFQRWNRSSKTHISIFITRCKKFDRWTANAKISQSFSSRYSQVKIKPILLPYIFLIYNLEKWYVYARVNANNIFLTHFILPIA